MSPHILKGSVIHGWYWFLVKIFYNYKKKKKKKKERKKKKKKEDEEERGRRHILTYNKTNGRRTNSQSSDSAANKLFPIAEKKI